MTILPQEYPDKQGDRAVLNDESTCAQSLTGEIPHSSVSKSIERARALDPQDAEQEQGIRDSEAGEGHTVSSAANKLEGYNARPSDTKIMTSPGAEEACKQAGTDLDSKEESWLVSPKQAARSQVQVSSAGVVQPGQKQISGVSGALSHTLVAAEQADTVTSSGHAWNADSTASIIAAMSHEQVRVEPRGVDSAPERLEWAEPLARRSAGLSSEDLETADQGRVDGRLQIDVCKGREGLEGAADSDSGADSGEGEGAADAPESASQRAADALESADSGAKSGDSPSVSPQNTQEEEHAQEEQRTGVKDTQEEQGSPTATIPSTLSKQLEISRHIPLESGAEAESGQEKDCATKRSTAAQQEDAQSGSGILAEHVGASAVTCKLSDSDSVGSVAQSHQAHAGHGCARESSASFMIHEPAAQHSHSRAAVKSRVAAINSLGLDGSSLVHKAPELKAGPEVKVGVVGKSRVASRAEDRRAPAASTAAADLEGNTPGHTPGPGLLPSPGHTPGPGEGNTPGPGETAAAKDAAALVDSKAKDAMPGVALSSASGIDKSRSGGCPDRPGSVPSSSNKALLVTGAPDTWVKAGAEVNSFQAGEGKGLPLDGFTCKEDRLGTRSHTEVSFEEMIDAAPDAAR